MRCRTDVMYVPTDRSIDGRGVTRRSSSNSNATLQPSAKRTAERRDVSQIVQELVRSARQEAEDTGYGYRTRIPDTSISDSIQFIAPFKRLPEVATFSVNFERYVKVTEIQRQ